MSERSRSFPSTPETTLLPPLSRVAIFATQDTPERAFLHFTDIPEGKQHDIRFLVTYHFFGQYAFQLWNASQPKEFALARVPDLENRGLWLLGDRNDYTTTVEEQATEVVERYDAFADCGDERTELRLLMAEREVEAVLSGDRSRLIGGQAVRSIEAGM